MRAIALILALSLAVLAACTNDYGAFRFDSDSAGAAGQAGATAPGGGGTGGGSAGNAGAGG